jgi:hypothetical protein
MKVSELSSNKDFTVLSMPSPDREINGAYVGDLLSWVMGRATEGCAWITIMSNLNVIAVATLVDVSCVILAEGVILDEDVLAAAKSKGVNILSSSLPAYETALLLGGAI